MKMGDLSIQKNKRGDGMFNVENAILKRRSVRTYDKRKVDLSMRKEIMAYAEDLENPLGAKVTFKFLDRAADPKGEKLGTYGIIKGAELYVGAKIHDEEYAPEALGYDFEKLVLYLTDLGLGTCWLGGTFNRGAFAEAMEVKDDEIFTIVSPVGYAADKMSLTEKIMRKGSGGDKRLPWDQLFFKAGSQDGSKAGFGAALTEADAGEYASVLELVRWAPSAVNRQPWRIVAEMADGADVRAFHFYQAGIKAGDSSSVQMHRIDMGIAICHFHLAALEKGLGGKFERTEPTNIDAPENTAYIVTWRCDIR